MTDDEKSARRDKIQVVSEVRAGAATFWLTRNQRDGFLIDLVDVWLAQPKRKRLLDGDVYWTAIFEDGSSAHLERWTLARAHAEVYNGFPDSDLQCIRVGKDEPVPKPEVVQ